MRFGELAELRRGVTRTKGRRIVKGPKSEPGKRPVNIPPHLIPVVKAHLRDHTGMGRDALLFPSSGDPARHMAPSSLYRVFYRPRPRPADRAIRAAAAVLGVPAIAAVISYQHAYELVSTHGETGWTAHALTTG